MNISVVKSDKEQLVLRVTSVGAGYMNALRRLMMTEVPVLAIEDVEFRKNSSALYDEQVAHRLGLVSLKTDISTYELLPKDAEFKAADSAKHHVKFTLSAKGPKVVTAEDLSSTDPKIKPVFPKTPIVKLLEGQELEFEAVAVMGQGIEHSKWNPGLIWYKEYPQVKVKKQPANAKELVSKYGSILEVKGGKLSVKEDQLPFYDLIEAVVAESNGAIEVSFKDDYLLYIESWGQLEPKEIMTEALALFTEQLDEVKSLAKA